MLQFLSPEGHFFLGLGHKPLYHDSGCTVASFYGEYFYHLCLVTPWAQNMCKMFSLVPSKKPSHQRNWCNKKLRNYWIIRFTKKHWVIGNMYGKIGVLVNFSIPQLKFCKIAQLFIVSVSLERWFFEKTRHNIFHIFRALAWVWVWLDFK